MKTKKLINYGFYGLLLTVFLTASLSLQVGCKTYNADPASENSTSSELAYTEYGSPNGTPVFYFHGFPGSHTDVELFTNSEELAQKNIRLIAVNRPGYSDSPGLPGRTLLDWPAQVKDLADQLGLERFSILAYSGGAPFGYACALELADLIETYVVVSGMTPWKAPKAKKGAAMMIPKMPKLILTGFQKTLREKPEKLEANMRKGFPEVDQQVFDKPSVSTAMMNTLKEGMMKSYDGAYQDALIYKSDWGFELSEITIPVVFYHGELDQNVRIESARYVARELNDCSANIMENEGHLSLIYKYRDEILGNFKATRIN